MKQRKGLWVLLLLAAVPILFFHESLFTDKVLSQADALFMLNPWHVLAPPNFRPSNWLLLDQTFQFFPWLSFARDQIQTGAIPLWNPYNYSGSPLLANGQSAVFSPFHLLFYVFPFLKMFSISACLRLTLAGLFTYLFLRSLGIGTWGSTLSALGYQTCGFLIVLLNYPHSNTACLLPLLFWLTERLCQRPSPRRIALLSFALFLQYVSGHVMTAVIQTLVVFSYGIYRSRSAFKTFRSLLLAILLGISASALILLPTLEYAMHSHASTYRLAAQVPRFPQGEDLKAMLAIFFPVLYGTPLQHNDVGPRNFNELNAGFTGLVILVFAILAVCGRWQGKGKEKGMGFFLVLTLIGFAASYHLPVLVTLLERMQLLRLFRPTSWLLFSAFSLSALAGFGLDGISSHEQKSLSLLLRVLSAATLFASFTGISVLLTRHRFFPELTVEMISSSLYFSIGILVAMLLFSLARFHGFLRPTLWMGGILFLVILEHFALGFRYNPTVKPENLFPKTPGIQLLQSDPDPNPFRILSLERVLFPNTGMMYRLQEVRGYDAVEYGPYMHYLEKLGPPQFQNPFFQLLYFPYYNSPLIDLLNVKYILSSRYLSGDFLLGVYDGEMKIYQNLRTFPRAHLFTDYRVMPDPERQLTQLVQEDFDVRKTVLLQGALPPLGKAAKTWKVDWVLYEPNRLVLDVVSDGSGILFLSEVDYPGWKATLDGEGTRILRANYLFRSIVLPSGTHRLEMRYDPLSFKAGLLVSGATLLFLIPLIFFL